MDVEVVAEIKRCSGCGRRTEVKLGEVFICFCTIVSAGEAHERPQTEESSVRGRGRYHLRSGHSTSDSNEGATSSRKKLKKELKF